MVTWLWNNCTIVSSCVLKTRGIFLQGALSPEGGGTPLASCGTASQILRKQRGCEIMSPFDGELSKMHEAEVHVFSEVVLCMGKQAMNEPEIKFTGRWNDYLEQYRKSARMVDGERIGGKARFLQDSGSSSLDTSCTLVQDRKRLATLKSIQMTQKENCMNWQSMLRNCISYRSIHSWRGCLDFQKGEMKKGVANMHVNADDSSVTMVMDLISSANDICIAFGICDYLGKFNEIDNESRRNSASVVLTPRLGERHSASTSAFCSWECLKLCSDSGGNLLLQPNQPTRMSVVERANEKTVQELYRLCQIADYAEIFNIGELLQTRPARNSAGLLAIPCGEVDRPTSVEGGQLLRRISPRSRIGADQRKKYFQRRRKRGHWCESAKHK